MTDDKISDFVHRQVATQAPPQPRMQHFIPAQFAHVLRVEALLRLAALQGYLPQDIEVIRRRLLYAEPVLVSIDESEETP